MFLLYHTTNLAVIHRKTKCGTLYKQAVTKCDNCHALEGFCKLYENLDFFMSHLSLAKALGRVNNINIKLIFYTVL